MSVSVSILQTGTIRIRPSHRTQSAARPVLLPAHDPNAASRLANATASRPSTSKEAR